MRRWRRLLPEFGETAAEEDLVEPERTVWASGMEEIWKSPKQITQSRILPTSTPLASTMVEKVAVEEDLENRPRHAWVLKHRQSLTQKEPQASGITA